MGHDYFVVEISVSMMLYRWLQRRRHVTRLQSVLHRDLLLPMLASL